MIIFTKYDIGQHVWVLINDVLKNGVVKNIIVPESGKFYYLIHIYEYPDEDFRKRYEGDRIWGSKREAMATLLLN